MVLERFRRVTRDGRWIPEVDGLRFVAIAAVLLFHMAGELQMRSGTVLAIEPRYGWLFHLIGNGDRGVRLFFVISGYILALPFARAMLRGGKPVSLRKFYVRRVTRLEPPYLAALAILTALTGLYFHGWAAGYFAHLAASAVYLHGPIFGEASTVNIVLWSLEVEIQFYLLAPLFMQVFRMRPAVWRRAAMLAVIAACGWVQVRWLLDGPRAILSLAFYVQYFLAGLLLADVMVLDGARIRASVAWDAVSVAGWLWVFSAAHDSRAAHALLPLVLAILCVAAMRALVLRGFFANPWIAVCGGMCYSIYLLHFALIAAVFKLTRRAIVFHDFLANYLVQIAVTLVPVVALCSLFYLLVERPCMDPAWPRRALERLTGKHTAAEDALDSSGVSG